MKSLLLFLLLFPVSLPAEERGPPDWWEEVSIEMKKEKTVVQQYFYIRDKYLQPAYASKGKDRKKLFQQSIKTHTQLLEWFQDKKHMPAASMAQLLIGKAYQKIGDRERARQAYQKCLAYQKHIRKRPEHREHRGEFEILSVIEEAKASLEKLR